MIKTIIRDRRIASAITATVLLTSIMNFNVPLASAASEGFNSPTSSSTLPASDDFTNPDKAWSSDDDYAEGKNGDKQGYSDFGFNIPPGTIDGIEVMVEGNQGNCTKTNRDFKVVVSNDTGNTTGTEETTGTLMVADSSTTLGSSSSLWGLAWTPSQVNDDFWLRIQARCAGMGSDGFLKLDHVSVKVYFTPEATSADISLTKTDDPDPVVAGQNLTYTLTVTNNDQNNDAENVMMTDTLPNEVEFQSSDPGSPTCEHDSGDVTCNLGDIDPESSVIIEIVVKVKSNTAPGTITNTATVESDNDSDEDNNTDTEDTEVFTVTKDFRFTSVNFVPVDENNVQQPAILGDLLPDADGDGKYDVRYVIKPRQGTVSSTNPGQLYQVITIKGDGVDTVDVEESFGTQFDVNPAHLGGGLEVIRVDSAGLATVLTETTQITDSDVNTTSNTVEVSIDLDTPLADDECLLIYVKMQTARKGLLPDISDFTASADVDINGGYDPPETNISATIEFV